MTKAEKLAALSEAATQGVWNVFQHFATPTDSRSDIVGRTRDDDIVECVRNADAAFIVALVNLYRANQLALIGPDAVEDVARAIYQAMNGHIATAHTWEQLEPEPKAFWRDKATAAIAALGVKP